MSGDNPMSLREALNWVVRNLSSNIRARVHAGAKISAEPFNPPLEEATFAREQASPSRAISNLFWKSLPWAEISEQFGSPTATDFGCGNGDYGKYWDTLLPSGLRHYSGIDSERHGTWGDKVAFPRDFFEADVVTGPIPPSDLFFSQSALEHFESDLAFMDRLQKEIEQSGRPSFQAHVFPAAPHLLLSGPHGYRAYNLAMVARILSSVPASSRIRVFGIGGPAVNAVHLRYVSVAKVLKRPQTFGSSPNYAESLTRAIKIDRVLTRLIKSFSVFGVTIESGFRLSAPQEK